MLKLCSEKGHEQVEKTLEMKKWSRNGKVMKQGRNVYDILAMYNTCSMCIYLTIQYQGECGHIEGHAYSVVFSRIPDSEALRGLMTKQKRFVHT